MVPDSEAMAKPINPKDILGQKKPQLWLIPGAALVETSLAFKDGASKYGPYNWRENPVLYSIYIDAALRHIHSLLDGEDKASDSGIHHASHAIACLCIILDALSVGNLIDDRPPKGKTATLIDLYTQKEAPI